MTNRNYSNTASTAATAGAIGSTDTTVAVSGFTGFPTPPFTAALGRGTALEEIVLVTAVNGTTLTIQRGYDGTTAKVQSAGTTVQHVVVAQDFEDANAHGDLTASVHGVTGSVVGTTDTQTLTNKTLTSPTITGGTQASPTITTPTISGQAVVPTATAGTAPVGKTQAETIASTAVSTAATSGTALTGAAAATVAANWSLTSASVQLVGNGWAYLNIAVTRTTTDLTFPSTGDMANTTIATLVPTTGYNAVQSNAPLVSMGTGRVAHGHIANLTVVLDAAGGTGNIVVGDSIQLAGYYKVA